MMRKNSLQLILAVAVSCSIVGCSEEEERQIKQKTFSAEVQEMRKCIHRDGILTRSLSKYKFATGSYPTTKQGLQALLARPKGMAKPNQWQGPYADDDACFTDFWGNPYEYTNPGKTHEGSYDIRSAGPDGQMGTDDDILNWDAR